MIKKTVVISFLLISFTIFSSDKNSLKIIERFNGLKATVESIQNNYDEFFKQVYDLNGKPLIAVQKIGFLYRNLGYDSNYNKALECKELVEISLQDYNLEPSKENMNLSCAYLHDFEGVVHDLQKNLDTLNERFATVFSVK